MYKKRKKKQNSFLFSFSLIDQCWVTTEYLSLLGAKKWSQPQRDLPSTAAPMCLHFHSNVLQTSVEAKSQRYHNTCGLHHSVLEVNISEWIWY